jgi:hypothetical protein
VVEPGFAFGDRVRIVSAPATESAGFAGGTGVVHGWTTPSVTRAEVIGGCDADVAYNVCFDETGADAWFAPQLVELVDQSAASEITIGDRRLVRDARGRWQEPLKRGIDRKGK